MGLKYPHLLEPVKVGNHVFKNRMICSASEPLFIQGNEAYPSEQLILHYANIAKNGAALVTCCGAKDPHFRRAPKQRFGPVFDTESTWSNYISHLADSIHFYNSKATMRLCIDDEDGYDVSTGIPTFAVAGDGSQATVGKETPLDMLEAYLNDLVEQALIFKEHGFDGVYLHMAYKITILGRFLSPLTNIRTDKYGGSFENRIKYPLEACARIKKACGQDFLIEVSISGEDSEPGGWTLDDSIRFAKAAEGLIDLMDIRCANIDEQSVTNFHQPNPYLHLAEAIKKSDSKVSIVTLGGYGNLDVMEDVIASGKADFIAMARTWISNPEYGKLAYSGRNEDVIPCIRCNKCHKSGVSVPWTPVCSVNPLHGMEHRCKNFIDPPATKKKVAILGGGPAGMEAALVCKSRGHDVTLYEKNGELGGQLIFAKYVSFKWPLRDFVNYLVNQVGKAGIDVKLNTEATPEMISAANYDTIIAAIGFRSCNSVYSGIRPKACYSCHISIW
jgi:2,4-dienoyl-CoA reductase-like NADH-dependent reductase (Old Yellow Enzyme family)